MILPYALIATRLALGPLILFGVTQDWDATTLVARRLGIATPALRQADSAADVVFWLFVLAAAQLRTNAIFQRTQAL